MFPPYKSDCLHFRGHVPCEPHKRTGVHCSFCSEYRKRLGRILIIKLGATGDVIRTTVILQSLREAYEDHEIWWLSDTPEVVPTSVQYRLHCTAKNLALVTAVHFDVAINLDKDAQACAVMSQVRSTKQFGYTLADGVPSPVNELAEHKFLTGLFDDVSKANKLSYPQEVLEMCGFEWKGQEYELDPPGPSPLTSLYGNGQAADADAGVSTSSNSEVANGAKPLVVGLNTGCGERWVSREWPVEYWVRLIELLHGAAAKVVLLGGPSEHERNLMLRERTGAVYEGTYPLMTFAAVVNECDVVVTAVTMVMHMAIAYKKRLVLLNNIFNPHEFELYGRGVIIQPSVECTCYFAQTCVNQTYRCMEHLAPEVVFESVVGGKVPGE